MGFLLALVIATAPPASPTPAEQMVAQMCQYLVAIRETERAADAAARANDWSGAQQLHRQAATQHEVALKQVEGATRAGAWSDTAKTTCPAGSFTGRSLEKTFKDGARAQAARAAGAADPKKAAITPDVTRRLQLEGLGGQFDATVKLATTAKQAPPAEAVSMWERVSARWQVLGDNAARLQKEKAARGLDTVPTARGPLKLAAVVKEAAKARTEAKKQLMVARRAAPKVAAAAPRPSASSSPSTPSPPPTFVPPIATEAPVDVEEYPVEAAVPPPAARPAIDYASAARLSAGRCNFEGSCLREGWSDDLSHTTCNFGRCEQDGWTTTFNDGATAYTTCNFGRCQTDGWDTVLPDGRVLRCTCNFGNCAKDGVACD